MTIQTTKTPTAQPARLDTDELERQVKTLYAQVAGHPEADYHFPTGRPLAERLGYRADLLDAVPAAALASFAGVGYALELARLQPGMHVLDLGSGSGTDSYAAAHLVGPTGLVTGIDMTHEQLAKAESLRGHRDHVRFLPGRLEALPLPDASVDAVISNGVVNLCPDKPRVFAEAARVLRPGGRLAFADIVAGRAMPETVTCSADLWSACIGGAAPEADYREAIESAGLAITAFWDVPDYAFLTERARDASRRYGVRAVTFAAEKR